MLNKNFKHPLIHHGTSQLERLLEHLNPDNLKIDDNSIDDLIAATHAFAELVQFFNEKNEADGDWSDFWEVEPIVFLAILGALDIKTIKDGFDQLKLNYLKLDEDKKDDRAEAAHALELIEYIRQLARKTEYCYRILPEELPLKNEILDLIKKDNLTDTDQLAGQLIKLIGFHKEAYPRSLSDPKDLNHKHYEFFFNEHWGIEEPQEFYKLPFNTGYQDKGFEQLDWIFNDFVRAHEQIKIRASHWFNSTIDNPQVTQPHVALFLAFLHLFEYSRNDLNELTERHLNYFYKDILHLREKDLVPDEVHLIFDLASNVDQQLVKTTTGFVAGKDKNKRQLIFKPLEDWVINKAKVATIKNVYVSQVWNGVFVNPDVSKSYRNQEELPKVPATMFRGFGDDPHLPFGDMGFALASPQLIMKEGERQLTMTIETDQSIGNSTIYNDTFRLYLTTEEGWTEIFNAEDHFDDVTLGFIVEVDNKSLIITIKLSSDFPPIQAPIEPYIHTQWPLIKIQMNPESEDLYNSFNKLRQLQLKIITLGVNVSGIKEHLVIQSDEGVFNGLQKVFPFGAQPELRNNFYIGSEEVFQKKLDHLSVSFDWLDPIDDYLNYYAGYQNVLGSSLPLPKAQVELLSDSYFVNDSNVFSLPIQQVTKLGTRRGTNVSGVVRDSEGKALPGVEVKTFYYTAFKNKFKEAPSAIKVSKVDKFYRKKLVKKYISTFSDDDGRYTMDVFLGDSSKLTFTSELHKKLSNVVVQKYSTVDIVLLSKDHEEGGSDTFHLIADGGSLNPNLEINFKDFSRDTRTQKFRKYSPTLKRGFIRLNLTNADFLHKEYTKALTFKTLELSQPTQTAVNTLNAIREMADSSEIIESTSLLKLIDAIPSNELPNKPYSPATNGITLNYSSEETISIDELNEGPDQYFYTLPFGGYKNALTVQEIVKNPSLLYPYPANDKENIDFADANIFIGLEQLRPGTSISLLIQVQPGTEPQPELQAPDIHWSYLTKNNTWLPFAAKQLLKDTTKGLTRTGIVQIQLPYDIVEDTTLFKEQFAYLRIAAIENANVMPSKSARALPNIVDIKAQAIQVKFNDRQNTPEHLKQPLPSATIGKLEESRSEIKKIDQPFLSFNGVLPESGLVFYQRVSERLRHKNRSVSIWDYEHLLLEQFPTVDLVKCLSHSSPTSSQAPGSILMAVIPNLHKRVSEPGAQPRFSEGDLREMEEFIRTRANLFTSHITVDDVNNIQEQYVFIENPKYDTIRFRFDVKFRQGLDIEYYKFELDDTLKLYLSPWLKDKTAKITFKRSLHYSTIIHFIEKLPYIDKVFNLSVIQNDKPIPSIQKEITGLTPISILTTYIDENKDPYRTDHIIIPVDQGVEVECL